jgi:hypothetical protein
MSMGTLTPETKQLYDRIVFILDEAHVRWLASRWLDPPKART